MLGNMPCPEEWQRCRTFGMKRHQPSHPGFRCCRSFSGVALQGMLSPKALIKTWIGVDRSEVKPNARQTAAMSCIGAGSDEPQFVLSVPVVASSAVLLSLV